MPTDPCRLCDLPHSGPRYTAMFGEHDWEPGWEPPRKPLPKAAAQPIPHPLGGITYPIDPHDPEGARLPGARLPFGHRKA